jgi:hypothetical protein
MIEALILALQVASASPAASPPQDWSALPVLPYEQKPDAGTGLSGFVRAEVKAGHCAAATASPQGWSLKVDLLVLMGAGGQMRRIVPRAIACPSVEQYAAGLVSSMARGNVDPAGVTPDAWYRTSLTFTWPA